MEFRDRISTYPGRVKLNPVAGQTNIYDMERADEPTEPGTPVNKALFEHFNTALEDVVQAVDNKVFEFSQWAAVDTLANGAPFGLKENGVLTPYIKLKDNYEGTGRVLVVRRHITHQAALYENGVTKYSDTGLDMWLNGEFLARFEAAAQDNIGAVPIDVAISSGDTQINRRAFLLSLTEYQASVSLMNRLGDPIAVFDSDAKRVALLNGVPVSHHTRSSTAEYTAFGIITAAGTGASVQKGTIAGIRPAFTLPAGFEVTVATFSTANTMATAEVI